MNLANSFVYKELNEKKNDKLPKNNFVCHIWKKNHNLIRLN